MKSVTCLILVMLAVIGAGCEKHPADRRDVVLDVAASMSDLYDSPRTHARELYSRYCSVCHGVNGHGDGFNAFNLTPRPRNFTDSAFIARADTTLIIDAITGGGGAVGLSPLMPKWGQTLSAKDVHDLANYIIYLGQQKSP